MVVGSASVPLSTLLYSVRPGFAARRCTAGREGPSLHCTTAFLGISRGDIPDRSIAHRDHNPLDNVI